MQIKLKFSLPVLFVALMLYLTTYAQDGIQPDSDAKELNNHPELNLNDDKALIIDFEGKSPKIQSAPRDAANPTNKKVEKVAPEKKDKSDEDPLSFNFLYLIIQKFKISDIVDD